MKFLRLAVPPMLKLKWSGYQLLPVVINCYPGFYSEWQKKIKNLKNIPKNFFQSVIIQIAHIPCLGKNNLLQQLVL